MNAAARAELFAETANRLGLPESLVEKDFWVCWMLGQLFSIGNNILDVPTASRMFLGGRDGPIFSRREP
jgi:hypothetical protein